MKYIWSIDCLSVGIFTLLWVGCGSTPVKESTTESGTEPAKSATPVVVKPVQVIKKKILVLKFPNRSPFGGEALSRAVEEQVREVLSKHEEFVMVTEEQLAGVPMASERMANIGTILERARALGISAVMAGKIENISLKDFGDEVGVFRTRAYTITATCELSIYDVTTEKQLFSKMDQAEATVEYTRFLASETDSSYHEDLGKMAVSKTLDSLLAHFPSIAKKIAWSGKIFKVNGPRFFINSGESSGLRKGQLLKIVEEGESVFDATGILLGNAPGRLKGVLRVVDFFGPDASIAVVHSGTGFAETDRVELYNPRER